MFGIQETTFQKVITYGNKSVWTFSQNLQISPICIIQEYSEVLELKLTRTHQKMR